MKRTLCLVAFLSLLAGAATPASAQGSGNTGARSAVLSSQALTSPGTVTINLAGLATVTVDASGSGSAMTFAFQGYTGTQWMALPAVPLSAGSFGSPVTSATVNGVWQVGVANFQQFRVNLTAIGGGTETFNVTAGPQATLPPNPNAAANPAFAAPVVGGSAVSPTNQLPAQATPLGTFAPVSTGTGFALLKASPGIVTRLTVDTTTLAAAGYLTLWDGALPGDVAISIGNPALRWCGLLNAAGAAGHIDVSFNPPLNFTTEIVLFFADGASASCRNKVTADSLTTIQIAVQGQ